MLSQPNRIFSHIAAILGLLDSTQIREIASMVESGEATDAVDAANKMGFLEAEEAHAIVVLSRSLAKRNPSEIHFESVLKEAPAPGDDARSSRSISHPSNLGKYKVLEVIGRGASGIIYHGKDEDGRDAALKVLSLELLGSEDEERFHREIETILRLDHPNIVSVYDYGRTGDYLYYAMEYVRGHSLRALLHRRHFVPAFEAAEYIRDAAQGLAYAHSHGIVHRDIKPSNLMLTENSRVRIVDFGLARELTSMTLTSTGIAAGTPAYMSPEQIEGAGSKLDERSDIYSLGVTLYEILSGERPFGGKSHYEVMKQVLFTAPIPLEKIKPELPISICDIAGRAMARLPVERYQTMKEMVAALTHFADDTRSLP